MGARLKPDRDAAAPVPPATQSFAAALREHVRHWLFHQRLTNSITPEGARAVEKLIEDLR